MRHRLSRALLSLQPVFMLAPVLLLVWAILARGWVVFGAGLAFMALIDLVVAWRGRKRWLAEEADASALTVSSTVPAPGAHALRTAADAAGPVLTRADGHSRLWAAIDEVADAAKVAAPERIVVQLETMAAVGQLDDSEGYELALSTALLAEASVPQLQAVLAHELAHVGDPDWAAVHRTRRLVTRWAMPFYESVPRGLLKLGGWVHLRLWLPVDAWAERPAERRADEIAFALAGPRTTAAALELTDRLDAGLHLVMESYLPLAARAQRRALMIDGVRELLRERVRIAALLAEAESEGPGWMQIHAPAAARIAAAQHAAEAGQGRVADERALRRAQLWAVDLIDGGRGWLAAAEVEMLLDDHPLRHAPVTDWATACDAGWRALLADDVHVILEVATTRVATTGAAPGGVAPGGTGQLVTVGSPSPVPGPVTMVSARMVLAAVDRLGVGAVVHDPELDEEGRHEVLAAIAARSLDRAGRLRLALSWAQNGTPEYFDGTRWWGLGTGHWGSPETVVETRAIPSGLVATEQGPVAPEPELGPVAVVVRDVAAGRASVGQLFDVLTGAGAALDEPLDLTAEERASRPGTFLSGHARSTVRTAGRELGDEWIVIIGSTGVWLVEQAAEAGWALPAEREQRQHELIGELAHAYVVTGGADQRRWPASIWVAEERLAQIRTSRMFQPRLELIADTGDVMEIVIRGAGAQVGYDLYSSLSLMAGKRLIVGTPS